MNHPLDEKVWGEISYRPMLSDHVCQGQIVATLRHWKQMKNPSIQPFTFPPVHECQNVAKINVLLTIWKHFKEYPWKIMGDYDQHCKTQKGTNCPPY
jgi:hypothetical protein